MVLVDLEPWSVDRLDVALADAGFQVLACVSEPSTLFDRVIELEPDVVIASSNSARRDTLESLMHIGERYPKPMLMLSDAIDPDTVGDAAAAGISTYAVQGVSADMLRSLIEVTVGHFRAREQLQAELDSTRRQMSEREVITRAKCLLMERYGMTEANAYTTLRNMAMARRHRLIAVARWVLERGTV